MPHADAELRRAAVEALERPGVLSTHFQPIADLARGVVAGYEALSRFLGPPPVGASSEKPVPKKTATIPAAISPTEPR